MNKERKIIAFNVEKKDWRVNITFEYEDGNNDWYDLPMHCFKDVLDKGLSTMNWEYSFPYPNNS